MKILAVSGLAWLIAQVIKLVIAFVQTKKLNFYAMFASGGMPSSHTSFVVSMALQVGMIEGFRSTLFGVAMCFCLIVMYDAAGVRHAVGRQAQMLNLLIDEYNVVKEVDIYKVKEILGHTPTQVVAGIFLGMFVGWAGVQYFH